MRWQTAIHKNLKMIAYEEKLSRDHRWALREGSMHFEKESAVHKTLERFVARLEELGVPYALAGAMAMFLHGYRRFTEDLDLVVTSEGLRRIHEALEGLGYVPPFPGSKQLRDTETGVRIEFLVTGQYPGDGKPKPVAFPDPAEAREELAGVFCLPLATLIELKLASGMTNPGRISDLGDVQNMIRRLGLPEEFVNKLHPFVQDNYRVLWRNAGQGAQEP